MDTARLVGILPEIEIRVVDQGGDYLDSDTTFRKKPHSSPTAKKNWVRIRPSKINRIQIQILVKSGFDENHGSGSTTLIGVFFIKGKLSKLAKPWLVRPFNCSLK